MVCANCGAVNPDDLRFCGQCGAGLRQGDEAPTMFMDPAETAGATVSTAATAITLGAGAPHTAGAQQSTALRPGTLFGTRYRILALLGEGGM